MSYFKVLAFLLLFSSSFVQGTQQVSPDQIMEGIAQEKPEYSNVVKLIASTPLKNIFSGSAIYLGPNEKGDIVAITNAHCLVSWVFRGKICLPLFLQSDSGRFYKIKKVKIHPKFNSQKKHHYDIAVLILDLAIEELRPCKPNYDFALTNHESTDLVAIGFGTKGGLGNRLSWNDGKKKGVKVPFSFSFVDFIEDKIIISYETNEKLKAIDILLSANNEKFSDKSLTSSEKKDLNTELSSLNKKRDGLLNLEGSGLRRFLASAIAYTKCHESQEFKRRTPKIGELGLRYGMSGGGCFFQDNSSITLVGIPSYMSSLKEHPKSWFRHGKLRNFGKYFTALGIPFPFVNPQEGDVSVFLTLGSFKDFIEGEIIEDQMTPIKPLFSSGTPH